MVRLLRGDDMLIIWSGQLLIYDLDDYLHQMILRYSGDGSHSQINSLGWKSRVAHPDLQDPLWLLEGYEERPATPLLLWLTNHRLLFPK